MFTVRFARLRFSYFYTNKIQGNIMIIRADGERNAFSPSSTMLYTLLQDKSSNMPYVTLDVCKINASLNESNGLNLFV